MSNDIIPNYSKEDYLLGTKPYEFIVKFKDNKLQFKQYIELMSEQAKSVGIRNFKALFKEYIALITSKCEYIVDNATDFEGQPLQLVCGDWTADDYGVSTADKFGFDVVACTHPILPVQRLVNIDTGIEKLNLAYRKGKAWRNVIADKRTLASNQSIIQLSDVGVAVNSENSRHLVRYLSDLESLNYDTIPEVNSVGRLGWVGDYGFSPYVEDLVFDGDAAYKHLFDSVREKGSYKKWLEIAKEVRAGASVPARMILAGAFSSILLDKIGALPFFIHLWGTTETGKTVALLLAASVYANPAIGEYIQTFDSTNVGQEMVAGFLNSMPLIIDELQIAKDKKDFDSTIYKLTEGVGRLRGKRTGGIQKTATWHNCIITTGEMPISTGSSGGGAKNRIIEIECNDAPLFDNPVAVAETVKKNYGHAGKILVEYLKDEDNVEAVSEIYKSFVSSFSGHDVTDKQIASASAILTADKIITDLIFKDGKCLTKDEVQVYMMSKRDVSQNARAYEFLLDTLAMNTSKFRKNAIDEIWGAQDNEYTYIIKSCFDKIMQSGGFNETAVLSFLARSNKISTYKGKHTRQKRFGETIVRCVWLKNSEIQGFSEIEDEDCPF